MRTMLYLGTRGCPPTLTDALDGYHDRLVILVPVVPELLGASLAHDAAEPGLREISAILAERGLAHGVQAASRKAEPLAAVFDRDPPDVTERLEARVLEGELVDALARHFEQEEGEVEALYVSRDALEILDGLGIRVEQALEATDAALVAR